LKGPCYIIELSCDFVLLSIIDIANDTANLVQKSLKFGHF